MEKPEIRPPPSENAWTDDYRNWHGWLRPGYLVEYPCAKLHFNPIRAFCAPHMQSCLANGHLASFLLGVLTSRYPQVTAVAPILTIIVKRRFTQGCAFGGPKNEIVYLDSILPPPQKKTFSVDFQRNRKFWPRTGFNMGDFISKHP